MGRARAIAMVGLFLACGPISSSGGSSAGEDETTGSVETEGTGAGSVTRGRTSGQDSSETSESSGTNTTGDAGNEDSSGSWGSSTGATTACADLPLDECHFADGCVVVDAIKTAGSVSNLCVGDVVESVACMAERDCAEMPQIVCTRRGGHVQLSHDCLPPGFEPCDEPITCAPPCLLECLNDAAQCCEHEDCPNDGVCFGYCCLPAP